jgi:hypothetical protein
MTAFAPLRSITVTVPSVSRRRGSFGGFFFVPGSGVPPAVALATSSATSCRFHRPAASRRTIRFGLRSSMPSSSNFRVMSSGTRAV